MCRFYFVHDLKHTFGRRLRAVDVGLEDRADLLGHKTGRITTHYSAAEIKNLVAAVEAVCQSQQSSATLTLLRRVDSRSSRKSPARQCLVLETGLREAT